MKTEIKSEFYWNGITKNRGSFILGTEVKTGEWKHYFDTGILEKSGKYVNGKKEGEWVFYARDGKLKCIKFFKNGKEIKDNKKVFLRGDLTQDDKTDNM